jgi:hypothetical protein
MNKEEQLSRRFEQFCQQTDLQRRWDREFHKKALLDNKVVALKKEKEREEYLAFLRTAVSSEDVISRVWQKAKEPVAVEPATRSQSQLVEASLSLPNSASLANTSVHLDGLQKSRAIINEAAFSYKETLKRLNAIDNKTSAEPHIKQSTSADIITKATSKSISESHKISTKRMLDAKGNAC